MFRESLCRALTPRARANYSIRARLLSIHARGMQQGVFLLLSIFLSRLLSNYARKRNNKVHFSPFPRCFTNIVLNREPIIASAPYYIIYTPLVSQKTPIPSPCCPLCALTLLPASSPGGTAAPRTRRRAKLSWLLGRPALVLVLCPLHHRPAVRRVARHALDHVLAVAVAARGVGAHPRGRR